MRNLDKKGQVAMEYFMTYGLAILIIIGIVSTPFFTEMLGIKDKLPQKVMFPQPLESKDYAVASGGKITILLVNNLGENVTISGAGYKGTDECKNIAAFSFDDGGDGVSADEEFTIQYTCPEAEDNRFKVYLSFNYFREDPEGNSIEHTHTGYILANG